MAPLRLGRSRRCHPTVPSGERDPSTWGMLDWDSQIGSVPFRGNIGLRYAETSAISNGFSFNAISSSVVPVTVGHTYHDWLPSLNAVASPTDDFLIRFAAAQEMSRPDLSNLLPGATVTKSGANPLSVTSQNPNLSPYRDKALDPRLFEVVVGITTRARCSRSPSSTSIWMT